MKYVSNLAASYTFDQKGRSFALRGSLYPKHFLFISLRRIISTARIKNPRLIKFSTS